MKYNNVEKTTLDALLDMSYECDLPVLIEEGSLVDNYLIINNGRIKMGKCKKKYKYIVVLERFLNSWSSVYDIILTDNIKRLGVFYKNRMEDLKEFM